MQFVFCYKIKESESMEYLSKSLVLGIKGKLGFLVEDGLRGEKNNFRILADFFKKFN